MDPHGDPPRVDLRGDQTNANFYGNPPSVDVSEDLQNVHTSGDLSNYGSLKDRHMTRRAFFALRVIRLQGKMTSKCAHDNR